jgi:hypothetical protein
MPFPNSTTTLSNPVVPLINPDITAKTRDEWAYVMKMQNQRRLEAEERQTQRRRQQMVELKEFLRRQAMQKREAEMRAKVTESKEEIGKVMGFLKSSVDLTNRKRDSSKEVK